MADKRKYRREPISLDAETAPLVQNYLSTTPNAILRDFNIMGIVATHRLSKVTDDDIEIYQSLDSGVGGKTVEWNKSQLMAGATLTRPLVLINGLMSIDYVYARSQSLDVLCVGPRMEAELFYFQSYGFDMNRVRGLDLMTYSEFIDLGDMHAMPYDDNSFDIVMLGWVLGYSSNPQKVADEVMRVCRPGGYVAISCTRPVTEEDGAGETYYYKVDDILQFFDQNEIHNVHLRHEPCRKVPDSPSYVMTIFELK